MKLRQLALAAAMIAGLANMTGTASAQLKTFYVNEGRVRAESKLGKDMNAVLIGNANRDAEQLGLKALDEQVANESKALQPQLQSLTEEALKANPTLKARVDALSQKAYELQTKQDQINQALSARSTTLNKMFAAVIDPAIAHVGRQAGADVVLSDPSVRYVKDTADLTSKVIARLDATVPTVQAMQTAVAPAGAAPAAAPAPAAPPPAPKPAGQ
jgi:Skp family chaperone for outer membrane proteins